jgi:hypothetical protein
MARKIFSLVVFFISSLGFGKRKKFSSWQESQVMDGMPMNLSQAVNFWQIV